MPTSPLTTVRNISIALQGGGTHAAFAWGALDQLLRDERVKVEAISGVSGGAMLAVVAAQGMLNGGRTGARDALKDFWKKVSIAAGLLPLRANVVDKFLSNVGLDFSPSTLALDYITRIFSPSQFNLFDINPMRGIVDEMVDFDALNKKSPIKLFINATHARTGKGVVFDHTSISLDAVMASACLPFIFKTVEVDGEPYWDGSLSACPALTPLVEKTDARDIVLVQVHPTQVDDVPTAATDILDRALEIGFNSVLFQELKTIELYNQRLAAGEAPVTVHTIDAQDILSSSGRASKLNAEWNFLEHLHDSGAQAAADWLGKKPALLPQSQKQKTG